MSNKQINHALKKFGELGIKTVVDGKLIRLLHEDSLISYSPKSEKFNGIKIGNGTGLDNLLNELK
jgi:hypothetical protein